MALKIAIWLQGSKNEQSVLFNPGNTTKSIGFDQKHSFLCRPAPFVGVQTTIVKPRTS